QAVARGADLGQRSEEAAAQLLDRLLPDDSQAVMAKTRQRMADNGQLGLELGNEQPELKREERLYLLLSLRPPYYYQMRDGTKRYEYRRKFFSRACTTFLYLGTTPRDPLSG